MPGDLMADMSQPRIAKGILPAADADAVAKASTAAVLVSNRGGHQRDGVAAYAPAATS
jgi:isopentenyl diphosphate isomerase/L-lactate dehydrogenase-like FMN-dependent dehydrogenase